MLIRLSRRRLAPLVASILYRSSHEDPRRSRDAPSRRVLPRERPRRGGLEAEARSPAHGEGRTRHAQGAAEAAGRLQRRRGERPDADAASQREDGGILRAARAGAPRPRALRAGRDRRLLRRQHGARGRGVQRLALASRRRERDARDVGRAEQGRASRRRAVRRHRGRRRGPVHRQGAGKDGRQGKAPQDVLRVARGGACRALPHEPQAPRAPQSRDARGAGRRAPRPRRRASADPARGVRPGERVRPFGERARRGGQADRALSRDGRERARPAPRRRLEDHGRREEPGLPLQPRPLLGRQAAGLEGDGARGPEQPRWRRLDGSQEAALRNPRQPRARDDRQDDVARLHTFDELGRGGARLSRRPGHTRSAVEVKPSSLRLPALLALLFTLGAAPPDRQSPLAAAAARAAPAGFSGKLRAVIVSSEDDGRLQSLGIPLSVPGIYPLVATAGAATPMTAIVLTPFSAKVNGRIGHYQIGSWPNEDRAKAGAAARAFAFAAARRQYGVPRGFIEVTQEATSTHVSESFPLGDFLTHGQLDVWPKYIVLDLKMVDKLELLLEELRAEGHPVRHLAVMSGFRAPSYNAEGVGLGGRSAISRHMYGDAADVFPDDDKKGWTDDINHDGRGDPGGPRGPLPGAEGVGANDPHPLG